MVNLEQDDLTKVLAVIRQYHLLGIEHKKYTKELEDIQKKLKNIGLKFIDVKQYEDNLMKNLHEKYGEFDLKELLLSLTEDKEHGNE